MHACGCAYVRVPANSSGKAEDIRLQGVFFNLPTLRVMFKLFRFYRTLLVIANKIHRCIEV